MGLVAVSSPLNTGQSPVEYRKIQSKRTIFLNNYPSEVLVIKTLVVRGFAAVVVVLTAWVGYGWQVASFEADDYLHLADQYEVTIRRDTRGVPHILGVTNPDVAFGVAFAQAEDNC